MKCSKILYGLAVTLALLGKVNLTAANTASDTEMLLNWAESVRPDLFTPHRATIISSPWLYRFYSGTGIYAGVNTDNHYVYVLGGPFGNVSPTVIDTLPNLLAVAQNDIEERLEDELTRLDHGLANMKTATEFFGQLVQIYELFMAAKDQVHALHLLESILTPIHVAQMKNLSGSLTIGSHAIKYLVKHAYAVNAPFTRFVPEDVLLAVTDAMFNITAGVVTGGALPLIQQSISTVTKVIDAHIAYEGLEKDTDKLVAEAQMYGRRTLHLHSEGILSNEQALAHFHLTEQISSDLLGRFPPITWPPTREAANKLWIIAQLGRIKIEEGPFGLSLELTGTVRAKIIDMDVILPWSTKYRQFADEIAVAFGLQRWEPFTGSVNLPSLTNRLNDTGITACANASSNGLPCPVSGFPGQDAEHGRDALAAAGLLQKVGGGSAGFDFTKLDANGNPLPASATEWSCVKDNHTGLIWEEKTTSGLRSMHNTYTWYNPDSSTNGGDPGVQNGGNCTGSSCDTRGYVQAVNAQGLCGANDWRMPAHEELSSIVDYSRTKPAIDTGYFPHTPPSNFWSADTFANTVQFAWTVILHHGVGVIGLKTGDYHIRLVRGGQ
jgi:hypothetical protein